MGLDPQISFPYKVRVLIYKKLCIEAMNFRGQPCLKRYPPEISEKMENEILSEIYQEIKLIHSSKYILYIFFKL